MVGAAAETPEDRARALLAHFERAIADQPERSRLGRLHYECARLWEHPLSDLDRAADHYTKSLAAVPDHLPSIRGIRRVLLAQGNAQAALAHFDTEARLTQQPLHKAWLLRDKALLLEHRLHGRKAALTTLAQAAELAPGEPLVVESLGLLQALDEAWPALDHTLELCLTSIADPRHRATLLAERARLAEARQGNPGQATELYHASLTQDPHAPGALLALKDLDHGQQRWQQLVAVLELEASQTQDPHVRGLTHYQAARILLDRLGAVDDGIAALERAVADRPEDVTLLSELARAYEEARRYAGVVRVLEQRVERAKTAEEKVVLMHRVGAVCEQHLDAVDVATAWYRRALTTDPTHLPSVAALERVYRQQESWEPLVTTLMTAAEAARDPQRRAAWYVTVGDLCEHRLNRPDAAIEQYARALGIVPDHEAAFRALARLLEAQSRFRELVELHERAVELAANAESRIAHLFAIGLYLEDALRAPARAIDAYRRILREDGKHLGAILAWQRAAERAEAWRELVTALETESLQTTDKERHADLLYRAGEVLAEHLDDLEGALDRLRRVLSLVPRHPPALAALARLYERHGRWDELLETYRKELKTTPPGPAAAALRMQMGEVAEHRLGRLEDAVALYREAVEAHPAHRPARRALEVALQATGKWGDLVTLLDQEIPLLEAPEERARTAVRIGEILEGRLGEAQKALASYERALADAPQSGPALDGRARLLAAAHLAPRLAEALAQRAASASEPSLAIAALYREGVIRRDDLNDPKSAIRCFEAILSRDPRHLGALRALELLYAREREWERAAATCATLDGVLTDVSARIAVLHRLARIQRDQLDADPATVSSTYFAILQLDATNVPALVALEELSLKGADRKLLAQIDAKLATLLGEKAAAVHQTRLAEALELVDPVSALTLFRGALDRDPQDHAAALGLARIAERHTDIALLEEAAGHARQVLHDPATAASLLVRAADAAQKTSDAPRAVALLRDALEVDPDHVVAASQLQRALSDGDAVTLIESLTQAAQRAHHRDRRQQLWISIARLQSERQHDLPAALAAYERVLTETPGNLDALLGQAELFGRDSQWEQAVRRLDQALAQAGDDPRQLEIRLRLAAIHDDHLRDGARALKHVSAVLKEQPTHRPALGRLLSLQLKARRYDEASSTAAQLIASSTDPMEAAAARVTLAEVAHARGETGQARQELELAIAVLGLEERASEEYKEMLRGLKRQDQPIGWRAYVAALERHLVEVDPAPAVSARIYLELSQVLGDDLRQNDEALQVLERGLSRCPDEPELILAQALRLEHAGDLNGAAAATRRVLDLQVTRAEAWRNLAALLAKMQRQADATLALAPLVAIGAATEADQARLAAIPCRAGMAPAGSMSLEEVAALHPSGGLDAIAELLLLANEALPRHLPADLGRFGLAARDRITARSGHALRAVSDRVASIFGIPEHQFFEHDAQIGGVAIELTDPVSLIVPPFVAALPEAHQVFLLARALALVALRVPAVQRLSAPELELLILGAAAGVGVSVPTRLDPETVADQGRRLVRLLSRRTRRALEDRATQLSSQLSVDFGEWRHRVLATSARAALIVTDDLPGSVGLVRRLEGDLSGRPPAEAAQGMRLAEDLLRFWVSEPAFRLRRRLGLL